MICSLFWELEGYSNPDVQLVENWFLCCYSVILLMLQSSRRSTLTNFILIRCTLSQFK